MSRSEPILNDNRGMVLPFPATAPFAVDLFLVGSNPVPVAEGGWLDPKRAVDDAPIQAALRMRLAPLVATKRTFVVVDGGDGALFATAKPWSTVRYLERNYGGYDSKTETFGGKRRVVEHTETEETQSGGVTVGRNGPLGYTAQSFLHFGTDQGHPVVAMMDLNSYQLASTRGQPQDRENLSVAVLLSDDSKVQTERYLAQTGLRPPGPVLCRTGIPRARDQDVFCFPPAGIVGHYRLVRGEPGWRMEFVEFVNAGV